MIMNKICFVYGGQGSVKENMGLDFYNEFDYCKELFDDAKKYFNTDILFHSPIDELSKTINQQPAILIFSYVVSKLFEKNNIKPSVRLGLSLGEYSSLTTSSVFSLKDAINIVINRSKYMANDLESVNSSMYAVLDSNIDKIKEVISSFSSDKINIANYNSYKQYVISGLDELLNKAIIKLKENNINKIIKLNVDGAFHTSLLENASIKLQKYLETININTPNEQIIFNKTGKTLEEFSKTNLINLLKDQIKSSVLFIDSINEAIKLGCNTFIEIGPKKVLEGLIKNINPNVNVYSVTDVISFKKVCEELK